MMPLRLPVVFSLEGLLVMGGACTERFRDEWVPTVRGCLACQQIISRKLSPGMPSGLQEDRDAHALVWRGCKAAVLNGKLGL